MSVTDPTITTTISEAARASIPNPSQAAIAKAALPDSANLHAKVETAPVAKTRARASAKAAVTGTQKSAAAAEPAVKSTAKLPAKAAAGPVARKTTAALTPAAKAVPKLPAKPAGKAAPAAKAAIKPLAKPALRATPKASIPQPVGQKVEKILKEKKPKLVRDSFTIPKAEYTVLEELKQRAGKLGTSIKKSELIRAGIKALAAMPDAMYLSALKVVPTVKTGRPSKK